MWTKGITILLIYIHVFADSYSNFRGKLQMGHPAGQIMSHFYKTVILIMNIGSVLVNSCCAYQWRHPVSLQLGWFRIVFQRLQVLNLPLSLSFRNLWLFMHHHCQSISWQIVCVSCQMYSNIHRSLESGQGFFQCFNRFHGCKTLMDMIVCL